MPLTKQDTQLLEAALIGFEHQREEIERKIAELRGRLGGRTASGGVTSAAPGSGRRTLSAAARQRIAVAQKKRWAAYKSRNGRPAAKPQKRILSAEGRARIIAATKKRWAAFRKAQKAS